MTLPGEPDAVERARRDLMREILAVEFGFADALAAYAERIREEERERAATVCEERVRRHEDHNFTVRSDEAAKCAVAIRRPRGTPRDE